MSYLSWILALTYQGCKIVFHRFSYCDFSSKANSEINAVARFNFGFLVLSAIFFKITKQSGLENRLFSYNFYQFSKFHADKIS